MTILNDIDHPHYSPFISITVCAFSFFAAVSLSVFCVLVGLSLSEDTEDYNNKLRTLMAFMVVDLIVVLACIIQTAWIPMHIDFYKNRNSYSHL